jgi:hypothetical protein
MCSSCFRLFCYRAQPVSLAFQIHQRWRSCRLFFFHDPSASQISRSIALTM